MSLCVCAFHYMHLYLQHVFASVFADICVCKCMCFACVFVFVCVCACVCMLCVRVSTDRDPCCGVHVALMALGQTPSLCYWCVITRSIYLISIYLVYACLKICGDSLLHVHKTAQDQLWVLRPMTHMKLCLFQFVSSELMCMPGLFFGIKKIYHVSRFQWSVAYCWWNIQTVCFKLRLKKLSQ